MSIITTFMVISIQVAQMNNTSEMIVKYYKTFAGYNVPLKLIQPFSKEEALGSRHAYYIGYFSKKNNILQRVEKIHNGKLIFTHVYSYHPNGVIKRLETTTADGKLLFKNFDERGKPIERNE